VNRAKKGYDDHPGGEDRAHPTGLGIAENPRGMRFGIGAKDHYIERIT
jgi:hypothetical protein